MDRALVQTRFNLLRSKFVGWRPPVLTAAEIAARERDEGTVEKVLQETEESFLGKGATLRLQLNEDIQKVIDKLSSETGTLEATKLAGRLLTQQLKETRDVRCAADALELLRQEHVASKDMMRERASADHDRREKDASFQRENWARDEEESRRARTLHIQKLQEDRNKQESDYQYTVQRRRQLVADEQARKETEEKRALADLEKVKKADFSKLELQVRELREKIPVLEEKILELESDLKEKPNQARQEAIQSVMKEEAEEAKAITSEQQVNIRVREREIALSRTRIEEQSAALTKLRDQIEEATKHNQTLASAAMNMKERAQA